MNAPALASAYNEQALATFLTNICPAVITELDRVSRGNAFASYGILDRGIVYIFMCS